MKKSIMALSATLFLELQFLHKSSVRRIQFRQWPTCHFTKRPFGTSCDNIRNVSRRCQKTKIRKEFRPFFEHLLFEGTENIKRGEWFKIVTGNGTNNANTTEDRTYYYEVFHLTILN
jgi:hypothetical protein